MRIRCLGMKYQKLDHVSTTVDTRSFFDAYISKRQPVVVGGLPDDEGFKAQNWKAGETEVKVEPLHVGSHQYGTDIERISMPFGEFLSSLRKQEGPHPYLTTQYTEGDPDRQTFIPPPASALTDDFPLVPRIMGNLFLQQVNLWLGKSKDGSSSGLEIKNLYPYGKLDALHPSGLISYKDGPVRPDGLPIRVALHARIKAIEQQMENLPKGKGKNKALSKERKALMRAHDDALDELAQYTLDEGGEFGMEDEVDDFDALMEGLGDDDDEGIAGAGPSGFSAQSDGEGTETDEDEKNLGHEDDGDTESNESGEPSHFSKIPTALLHNHLGIPTTAILPPEVSVGDFPGLKKATAPYVVDLNAGEMLYLPASWWHEVTSTSSTDGDGIHMAFNYWFYPPTSSNFDAPYEDTLVWDYFRQRARDGDSGESQAPEAEGSKRRIEEGSSSQSKKKAKR